MIVRRCTYPGCNTVVAKGRRCADHPYEDNRTKPRNPKYNRSTWKRLRAAKLRRDPLCAWCLEIGRTVAATEVDHVDGNSDNDAWENLSSKCASCHSRKTALQDGAFGRRKGNAEPRPAIGLDGWPIERNNDKPGGE